MIYKILKKPFFGRYQKPWQWPETVERAGWEAVQIESDSGAKLAALYGAATGTPRPSTIVCAHPMGTAAKGFFLSKGHAAAYRSLGYNVLLFDFNGFGESENGDFHYPKDILAAGRWARQKHPDHLIGLYGISFGSAWATCALAEANHPFGAAVLECPFTTLEEYWYRYKTAYTMLKLVSFVKPSLAQALRPIEKIRDVSSLGSLLFIYGEDDDTTPKSMGQRFLDAYRAASPENQAELWIVPGAKHTHAFAAAQDEYIQRLTRCFHSAAS